MATSPSVPSHVASGHCSGSSLSPVGGSRWLCEDGGPLPPRPSPNASTVCRGSPPPWKPLPVPGPQRDGGKRGPWPSRAHPGGARRMGCPHKLPLQKRPCGTGGELPEMAAPGTGGAARRAPARPGRVSLLLFLRPPRQVFVVELLGRRCLLLFGFSICFTACCVLTVALALQVRRGTRGPCVPPIPAAHCPLPAASGGIAR